MEDMAYWNEGYHYVFNFRIVSGNALVGKTFARHFREAILRGVLVRRS